MAYKKNIVALGMVLLMGTSFVACGTENQQTNTGTDTEVNQKTTAEEQTDTDTTAEKDNVVEEADNKDITIPAYEYPGPELFYSVLYKYLIDEYASQYPDADVTIPCPIIVSEDDSDREDIKVYGDFWVLKYDLKGKTLENTSGGSYPGCIHVKTTDDGYEVTSMEVVGDGSNFTPTAKKIFGTHYEDLLKAMEDTEARDKTRAQIIANYVAANGLSITEYKDSGWDPVKLPEENIDSFYSQLD